MGFLSKINKKLGFSKGTKKRLRDLKRREALGFRPSYVENPMGRILKPRGLLGPTLNRSALQRKIAEMGAIRKKSPNMPITFDNPSFRMIGTPQPIPERMPQKRGGFGFGLGEAIRRLNQQQGMMPQPIPRAEIDISALEPLPMGEMPMTQDLPEVAPVGMMAGRTLQQDFPAEPRMMMAEGDEADSDDFPDLSGDGETTFKDVLIGRGVDLKAEGGEMMTQENEIDAMLGGMGSEESGAMEDLEQMAPEMEMIDQLVTMVVQMIQQGASEEEVIMFLREQGLDDEDIGTVLQLVAEMAEAEAMPQDGIGAELEQLV